MEYVELGVVVCSGRSDVTGIFRLRGAVVEGAEVGECVEGDWVSAS